MDIIKSTNSKGFTYKERFYIKDKAREIKTDRKSNLLYLHNYMELPNARFHEKTFPRTKTQSSTDPQTPKPSRSDLTLQCDGCANRN